ncbi:hypothetical protein FPQ18DRAFT_339819 [Pyronema domesticum]|nr:hypothetical protein FPQ18DRAFT_339819 [Pyronema domesticum]
MSLSLWIFPLLVISTDPTRKRVELKSQEIRHRRYLIDFHQHGGIHGNSDVMIIDGVVYFSCTSDTSVPIWRYDARKNFVQQQCPWKGDGGRSTAAVSEVSHSTGPWHGLDL